APGEAGVLEERDVRPRIAALVAVEQVIHGRVVLVDRLLHESQPEHAGVEVDVLLGLGGHRGDVVDAFELHRRLLGRGRIATLPADSCGVKYWGGRPETWRTTAWRAAEGGRRGARVYQ